MKLLFKYTVCSEFNININGIQIKESPEYVEVFNDPFRSVPLFVTRDVAGELIIFSDFDKFYDLEGVDHKIDEVGFWEIVLYGSGLWTRTLYENVEQMPGASKIVINKQTNAYSIERYWDYNVYEDKSIDSIEKAAQGLYDRLDVIFSKLDRDTRYVMGMSGGMDSRITLAFLSKYIPAENLQLFTYGFDERLLEFKYASQVATVLGFNAPVFHKLTKNSYLAALKYLPKSSGGQIGINHCHILDFLNYADTANSMHISTYYSDAIFGWDSVYPKKNIDVKSNYYIKHLEKYEIIKNDIKSKIMNDSTCIFNTYDIQSNYSSVDEYKYTSERNQKFHMYLSSIQARKCKTLNVYSDFDLMKYATSIPAVFRQNKKIIDYILGKYFPEISTSELGHISSRFQWGEEYSNKFAWSKFRLLNRSNALLRVMTNGKFQLFNEYQTEELERLLYSDFKKLLKQATSKFVDKQLMSVEQKAFFDKLPVRAFGVGDRYALISLAQIID